MMSGKSIWRRKRGWKMNKRISRLTVEEREIIMAVIKAHSKKNEWISANQMAKVIKDYGINIGGGTIANLRRSLGLNLNSIMSTIECVNCGKKVKLKNWNQKFCSYEYMLDLLLENITSNDITKKEE